MGHRQWADESTEQHISHYDSEDTWRLTAYDNKSAGILQGLGAVEVADVGAGGQPVTYRDLSTATGLSTSTIYLIAQNKSNRADLTTIESMLEFFSERLGQRLSVDDVLAWEADRAEVTHATTD